MIIYFDGPNVNFINSIIEYDLIKKLLPEYTLNLLISDGGKQNENNDEKSKSNENSPHSNMKNIQRELINLLSYDYDTISNGLEKDDKKEEEEEEEEEGVNIENNSQNNLNIDRQNTNNSNNSSSKDNINYINNPLFNNRINSNLHNINNSINMNIPERINTQLKNNLNENMGANIGENMGDKINNFMYINNNMSHNSNDKIWNNYNNQYNLFYNNSINGINNPIPFNINNSINNINNSRIINDINYNNNENANINSTFFNKNSFNQNQNFNFQDRAFNISPNIQPNNINNYDNNHINIINNPIISSLQNMAKAKNISNANNSIPNINYINNLNYINNVNDFSRYNNVNNVYNINLLNNNLNNNSNNKSNNVKDNKYLNMNLSEITNKLDIIAKKQPGCRFLENLIKTNENSFEIINNIFYPKLFWVKLYELCNDLFGNYFIQTIIPKLNDKNMISFTNLVINNLLKLCLNPHGTRVVQVLIENIKDNKNNLLILLTNYLAKIMDKLINDLNGSFVLMHYAKEIKNNDIIYNFLNNNIVEICTKSYSCSALQKFIDLGTNIQKIRIINNIINNTNYLIGNQCGLYVLQFIMDKKNYQINDQILNTFINNIIKLSKKKYSSNVIEKCLETCSPKMVNKLIEIFNNEIVIRDLIKDMFGNYVIQKLLIVCVDDKIRNHILNIIASEFNALSNLSFGNKLIKKLMMAYPEIKSNL